jgi:hypothetical protein
MVRSLLIAILALFVFGSVSDASANQCVLKAFKETRAAGNNQRKLKELYNRYFGEALARHSVRARWSKMDQAARKAQTDHARNVVVSLASRLSKYADAQFSWQSSAVAIVTLGRDVSRLTVYPAGGCRLADVCVKDVGCLSNYIGDASKLAKR